MCNAPVILPATRPTRKAHSSASHGLMFRMIRTVHTAAPVHMEPSTVRSAISRILYVI